MRTDGQLLDLREIPQDDLKVLIELCARRGENRFLQDNFVILSRILFARREIGEMAEYTVEDLAGAAAVFAELLDFADLPDEHPTKTFLRFNISAAAGELERRKRKATLRAV